MFIFTPSIFATLTSVAVLISNNVVANANPISHESRQATGCTYVTTGVNVAYTVHIPALFIGSDSCAGLFNLINSGQPWSQDPIADLTSPGFTNITGIPITNWQCVADTDANTLVEFSATFGALNNAILSNDFSLAFLNITGLACN
ncbi:hypothetical protein V8E54_003744 [Elaphomyces granulatus]|jgi:hypothetical protein